MVVKLCIIGASTETLNNTEALHNHLKKRTKNIISFPPHTTPPGQNKDEDEMLQEHTREKHRGSCYSTTREKTGSNKNKKSE